MYFFPKKDKRNKLAYIRFTVAEIYSNILLTCMLLSPLSLSCFCTFCLITFLASSSIYNNMYIGVGEGMRTFKMYLSVFFYKWSRPLEDGVPAPPGVFHKSKRKNTSLSCTQFLMTTWTHPCNFLRQHYGNSKSLFSSRMFSQFPDLVCSPGGLHPSANPGWSCLASWDQTRSVNYPHLLWKNKQFFGVSWGYMQVY